MIFKFLHQIPIIVHHKEIVITIGSVVFKISQ
jgi:hypothetical protein